MIASERPLFTADQISMSFAGVQVLSQVSVSCFAGEVHAIIGENGAGKSTLMKIMGGYLQPKSGRLLDNDILLVLASPAVAEAKGIVLVHQEILLAPHLTVAQNIFLGRELHRGILVDDREMNKQANGFLAELGAHISATDVVERLSIANRQLVQIARALSVPHRVVIFDEPTASLTPTECDALFNVIEQLKAKNCAVIYISHRLNEVKRISDRVSVLRDGRLITSLNTADVEPIEMAKLMVGRDMNRLFPLKNPQASHKVALEANNFQVPGYVSDASFKLHYGEILGFAGLVGAGRTELFEGIMGLRTGHGEVLRDAAPVHYKTPGAANAAGIVYVTEDRKGKGLLLDNSLGFNLTLAAIRRFSHRMIMDLKSEKSALDTAIHEFDIRTKSATLLAGQLSGGNQQKLLLAKMMELKPAIIVIDEPTRGVDIGAKGQIYEFIVQLAAKGLAVVVISSEMPELIGLCHRVMVMNAGRVVGEVSGGKMTEKEIVVLATGVVEQAA